MNWFQKIFGGGRTRRVASGSLPLAQLESAAFGMQINLHAAYGIDVISSRVDNTNSMIPTFDSNCVLLLEKVPFESLGEGDIVTFKRGTQTIGHRLQRLTARGWEVMGDGNAQIDQELVTPENLDRRCMGILYAKKTETTDQ